MTPFVAGLAPEENGASGHWKAPVLTVPASIDPSFPFRYDELTHWACGAAGSAPDWQSGGQGFDPPQVHFGINRLESPAQGLLLFR